MVRKESNKNYKKLKRWLKRIRKIKGKRPLSPGEFRE